MMNVVKSSTSMLPVLLILQNWRNLKEKRKFSVNQKKGKRPLKTSFRILIQ